MINYKYKVVGGNWNDTGGMPSNYVDKLFSAITALNPNGKLLNGGYFKDLKEEITALNCDVLIWMPNIDNDKPKLVDQIKKSFPELILVTSKNNRDKTVPLPDMIHRALSIKANLFISFTQPVKDIICAELFDPLGNCFCDSSDIDRVAIALVTRLQELTSFTRVKSMTLGVQKELKGPPAVFDFLYFVMKYADVFQKCVKTATKERFLGNASFRCEHGFPSFKSPEGNIFVSRRNIDKKDIGPDGFVQVKMADHKRQVLYYGLDKPSVGTPIQLMLYKYYSKINYMIHSHAYIKNAPFTKRIIPCGAIDEFYEIVQAFPDKGCSGIEINLKGHGSIIMVNLVKNLDEIHYYPRPLPEISS